MYLKHFNSTIFMFFFNGYRKTNILLCIFPKAFKFTIIKFFCKFFNYKMPIICGTIMKHCRNFFSGSIPQITNTVSHTSIFTSVMKMITNFSIVFKIFTIIIITKSLIAYETFVLLYMIIIFIFS